MKHRRIPVPRRFEVARAGLLVVLLSSCATTINSSYDSSATTVVTTTTIPRGTPGELLSQLIDSTRGLSSAVAEGDRETAVARLSNVQAQWQALEPQLDGASAEVVADVQRMVDLATSAVQRKRPADADKALLLLPIITSALQDLGIAGNS